MTERTFSPRELADVIGVSESSVKRWVDAGELVAGRTSGGHRRIALADAIRYIRHNGMVVVNPGALGLADLAQVPDQLATADVTADLLSRLLLDGEAAQARGLIVSAYLRGEPLAVLCDGPVRAAMHRIGEEWEHARRGIYLEHHATEQFVQAFSHIRALMPVPEPSAPLAVGAAAEGDPYLLPSLMVSAVVADLGFRMASLGPDTPSDVLAETAIEQGARLVCLSASVADDRPEVEAAVVSIAAALQPHGIALAVGGRALDGATIPALQHVYATTTMQELARLGRSLLAEA